MCLHCSSLSFSPGWKLSMNHVDRQIEQISFWTVHSTCTVHLRKYCTGRNSSTSLLSLRRQHSTTTTIKQRKINPLCRPHHTTSTPSSSFSACSINYGRLLKISNGMCLFIGLLAKHSWKLLSSAVRPSSSSSSEAIATQPTV